MDRRILWTGGWDSTFRMLQLALEGVELVQPIYVTGTNRPSESIEIQTMNRILPMLRERSKGTINKAMKHRLFKNIITLLFLFGMAFNLQAQNQTAYQKRCNEIYVKYYL